LGTVEGARVADIFAGSGSLGIEALSRGAAFCVFLEKDAAALGAIRENLSRTGLAEKAKLVRLDVLRSPRKAAEICAGFDIIFLDPPYAVAAVRDPLRGMHRLMGALSEAVKPDAVIMVRHRSGGFAIDDSWNLRLTEKRRLGEMEFTFLSPARDEEK